MKYFIVLIALFGCVDNASQKLFIAKNSNVTVTKYQDSSCNVDMKSYVLTVLYENNDYSGSYQVCHHDSDYMERPACHPNARKIIQRCLKKDTCVALNTCLESK